MQRPEVGLTDTGLRLGDGVSRPSPTATGTEDVNGSGKGMRRRKAIPKRHIRPEKRSYLSPRGPQQ